jgi:hypothetical protein
MLLQKKNIVVQVDRMVIDFSKGWLIFVTTVGILHG